MLCILILMLILVFDYYNFTAIAALAPSVASLQSTLLSCLVKMIIIVAIKRETLNKMDEGECA